VVTLEQRVRRLQRRRFIDRLVPLIIAVCIATMVAIGILGLLTGQ
jgi:hypothetical protein